MTKQLKLPFNKPQPVSPAQQPTCTPDKFYRFREAARILNLKYHVVQKAAKKGTIPTYNLGGKRPYVRLVDILAIMKAA